MIAIAAVVVLALAGHVSGQSVAGCAGIGSTAQTTLLANFRNQVACMKGLPNYASVGSKGGVNGIKTRTHDYALSDAPVLPCDKNVINVAYAIGLMSVHTKTGRALRGLRLNGCALALLYTAASPLSWNNARFTALNPGLKTVNVRITRIRRADESGTTYTFTNLMSVSCPTAWKFGTLYIFSPAGLVGFRANSVQATGTGGVRTTYTGQASAVAYIASGNLPDADESPLAPANNFPTYIKSGATNFAVIASGLNVGQSTCNSATTVTALRRTVYPFVYLAWFLAWGRTRPGQKACVKNVCACLMSAGSQAQLGNGRFAPDFRPAPAAVLGIMRGRCNLM